MPQEEQAGNIDSELATVISSIALACKQISSLVTRSGISNLTGAAGGANFSVGPSFSMASELALTLSQLYVRRDRCSSRVRTISRSRWRPEQGEDQKKLDVVSNEVFSNALRASGRTGVIASEEEDVPVAVEETYSGTPSACRAAQLSALA